MYSSASSKRFLNFLLKKKLLSTLNYFQHSIENLPKNNTNKKRCFLEKKK